MAIKYQPGGVTVAIGKAHDVSLPTRVFRGRATCMHFDTDKSFLLPSSVSGVRNIVKFFHRHPGASGLVNGHTDLVGDAAYNLQLSNERAAAVAAYLLDKVDDWLAWYRAPIVSKRWATLEDQHMLRTVVDGQGAPYYAGAANGVHDAATQDALRRFQGDNGLAASGSADDDTRRALVGRYMALAGTSLPAGTTLVQHGCGKFHPIDATAQADEGNRRVEIFLFDGPIDPPPAQTCRAPGCAEYPQWVGSPDEDVDLCQAASDDLDLVVVDPDGQVIPGATVTIDAPAQAAQTSDDQGLVSFAPITPGTYTVTARRAGYGDNSERVVAGGASSGAGATAALSASQAKGQPGGGPKQSGPQQVVLTPVGLVVDVLRLCSLAGSTTPTRRWNSGGSVGKDEVFVRFLDPAQGNRQLDAQLTDARGRAVLAQVPSLPDGNYQLDIQPWANVLASNIAGPFLNPPQDIDDRTGAKTVERIQYREHFIDLTLKGGKLDLTQPVALHVAGTLDANVFTDASNPLKVTVDLKPVWIGSRNFFNRYPPNAPLPRKTDKVPKFVIIHRTDGLQSAGISHFIDDFVTRPNAHYLVDLDGHVYKYVRDDRASGHIDKGFWAGDGVPRAGDEARLRSIGIETFNGGPDSAFAPDPDKPGQLKRINLDFNNYTPQQIEALRRLLEETQRAWGLTRADVCGHGDADTKGTSFRLDSGDRRFDPGLEMDWKTLWSAGVSINCDPASLPAGDMTNAYAGFFANSGSGVVLKAGSREPAAITALNGYLKLVGYSVNDSDGVTVSATYTGATQRAVQQFQMRAFSSGPPFGKTLADVRKIEGILDEDTATRLRAAVLDAARARNLTPPA
jgi:N-acetyl-anhydromuramyl-L-alanine amidase AmpD/peptidoglycan hydrolase-like protein with peptidoglycan-binding domain